MSNQRKSKTYRIAILGILTAIIILQNFVPFLGYIPILPLKLTIIHITVIVAAFVLGTRDGMLLGLIWGLVRLFMAYTLPTSPLDLLVFTNPLISVFPRLMVGVVAGLVIAFFRKRGKERSGMVVASICGSLTNTILVLGLIALLYGNEYAASQGVDPSSLMVVLAGVVATNGLAEAIASAIIAPLLSRAIMKVRR